MSGGRFNYNQYRIREIADEVEDVILKNRKRITEEEENELKEYSWYCDKDGNLLKEYLYQYDLPIDIIKNFTEGWLFLRMAEAYTRRIDWLLSGDDGEESFIKRLKEETDKVDLEFRVLQTKADEPFSKEEIEEWNKKQEKELLEGTY